MGTGARAARAGRRRRGGAGGGLPPVGRWGRGVGVAATGARKRRGTGLWVVGAHGGSGASTRAGLLDARRGPVVAGAGRVRGRGAGGGDGAHLCRQLGGRSGRGRGVSRGGVPGGRAGGTAAGGGRSRQTPQGSSQARPRCVGAFPLVLGVPWQPAWKLTRPGEAPRSLRVLRITKTTNNSGRKNS